MKHYLPAVLLLLSSITAFSQTTPDSSRAEQYCMVRIWETGLSSKVEITVDYGEPMKFGINASILKDEETGKKKKFKSEVDALNYFGRSGWKLVNAFPVVEGRSSYTRYLFKKTTAILSN